MTLSGIDVSHWQARTPPLGTMEFVFVKATEGTAADRMWATHAANVRDAGKVLGAYHFGRHSVSPKAQASAFLNTIGPVKLVALDLERGGDGTLMTNDEAVAFIRAVQLTGRKVGLYHSESGFPYNLGQDWNWIAKWGTEPPRHSWAFWQWDGSPLDRDRFSGTIQQLHALAGLPTRYRWVCKPTPPATVRKFYRYHLNSHGHIDGRTVHYSHGAAPRCSRPRLFQGAVGHRDRTLVRIIEPGRPRTGWYVSARFAEAIP